MRRVLAVVVLATIGAGIAAATAVPAGAATAAAASVSPVLECSWKDDSGQYRSLFGYNNGGSTTVEVPIGSLNRFTGTASADAGQPTSFDPGRHVGVFVVTHSGTIVWSLTGRTSTAPGKVCDNPPVPAAAAGIQGLLVVGVVSLVLLGLGGWFTARRHRTRNAAG